MIGKPLISVIVPVYNTAKYLASCVKSISEQSYENLEILLIDDGSTDQSPAICDELAKSDARIVVIHKANGGVSSARNLGLERANGEYIAFVDSDDSLSLDCFEKMMNKAWQTQADCVFSGVWDEKMNSEILSGLKTIEFIIYENKFGGVWGKIYKKSLLNGINFALDEKVGEDFSFLFDYFTKCDKVAFISENLYNYRVESDTSVMHNGFNPAKHGTLLKVSDRFRQKAKKIGNADLIEASAYSRANSLLLLLTLARNSDENSEYLAKFIDELRLIQGEIYANKKVSLKFKIYIFLLCNCYKFIKFIRKLRK